jgi:hypothetical protein
MIDPYSSPCKKGDVIGVIVDVTSGKLEFSRNGFPIGIAFFNIKGPLSPCISLLKG